MVIRVDTREQRPLKFSIGGTVTAVTTETLLCGDYSVRFTNGTVPPVYFERKSLGDLYGTMTSGYSRFKAEMNRAVEHGIKLILLIEVPLSDVADGYKHSKFEGSAMVQKLFTLMVRYNLPVVFCTSRVEASTYIVETFEALGREMLRERK